MTLKQIRKAWVKALRSGKYKQGRNKLRNKNNEYCCLGVLCELAVKEGVIPEPKEGRRGYSYNRQAAYPPVLVAEWAGLKVRKGSYSNGVSDLAHDNDNGKSFDKIADTIEREPEGLFKNVT